MAEVTQILSQACENRFSCLPSLRHFDIVLAELLLEIRDGMSNVATVFANYSGGQPTFTPASGTGTAVDTSNGTVWHYYSGAWH